MSKYSYFEYTIKNEATAQQLDNPSYFCLSCNISGNEIGLTFPPV